MVAGCVMWVPPVIHTRAMAQSCHLQRDFLKEVIMTDDFETHPTGTFMKLLAKDVDIRRLREALEDIRDGNTSNCTDCAYNEAVARKALDVE